MMAMWEYNPLSIMQPTEITPRIRNILQQYAWPETGLSIQEYISRGKNQFFNFTFPWYSEDKTGLEDFKTLFLSKYWLYQIGQETEELFKLQLQVRLMEKMPYWEKIYLTTLLKYDPISNRELKINYSQSGDSREEDSAIKYTKNEVNNSTTRIGSSNVTQDSQSIGSDNPQVTVNTEDYASVMNRGKLQDVGSSTDNLTETQKIQNDISDTANKTKIENTNYNKAELGFVGEDRTNNLINYRNAIVNLNLEISEYLKPCFLFSVN